MGSVTGGGVGMLTGRFGTGGEAEAGKSKEESDWDGEEVVE